MLPRFASLWSGSDSIDIVLALLMKIVGRNFFATPDADAMLDDEARRATRFELALADDWIELLCARKG